MSVVIWDNREELVGHRLLWMCQKRRKKRREVEGSCVQGGRQEERDESGTRTEGRGEVEGW